MNNEIDNDFKDLKENKLKNFMIVFLSIVVILLAALLIYVVFIKDKVTEKLLPDFETTESTISKEMEDKIKKDVENQKNNGYFPYTNILTDNINYDELYKAYVIVNSLPIGEYKAGNIDNCGLTETELNKHVVYNGGMSSCAKADEIKSIIKDKFDGYIINLESDFELDVSNIYVGEDNYNRDVSQITYDKQLNAFFVTIGGGGVQPQYEVKVLDSQFKTNVYTVKYSYKKWYCGMGADGVCYYTNKIGDEVKFNSSDDVSSKLPQYEISFKINGDKYEFLDIKKIN